jgi:hypothetical protein
VVRKKLRPDSQIADKSGVSARFAVVRSQSAMLPAARFLTWMESLQEVEPRTESWQGTDLVPEQLPHQTSAIAIESAESILASNLI